MRLHFRFRFCNWSFRSIRIWSTSKLFIAALCTPSFKISGTNTLGKINKTRRNRWSRWLESCKISGRLRNVVKLHGHLEEYVRYVISLLKKVNRKVLHLNKKIKFLFWLLIIFLFFLFFFVFFFTQDTPKAVISDQF